MKELTTEQKAQRYDEAIERANEMIKAMTNVGGVAKVDDIQYLFPELKESEDERIRKDIVFYIAAHHKDDGEKARWLAWLEKQGYEPNWCHHNVDLSNCSEEYRKAYYDGWNNCNMQHSQCESEKSYVLKCLINGMKFYYEDNKEATWGTEKFSMKVKDILSWLEKQGNKDMGISNTTKQKLKDNLDNALEKETPESWNEFLEKQGEQKPILSMPEFKEGDILYNKDSYASDSIFIFKGMSDKTNAYLCYVRLYNKKDFTVYSKENWDEGVGIYGGEFYLANHEQKELLFSEIEKAGYKWNPNKKKMEKIEQKQVTDYPDYPDNLPKDNWELIHEFVNKFGRIPKDEDELNVLVEYILNKQKPAWSEDDEDILNTIINHFKVDIECTDEDDMVRWLKSLKERFNK